MKKRILTVLLFSFIIVVLTASSVSALTGTGTESDPYIVTTEAEFREAVENSVSDSTNYIKLGASFDIVSEEFIDFTNPTDLDLNGETITFTESRSIAVESASLIRNGTIVAQLYAPPVMALSDMAIEDVTLIAEQFNYGFNVSGCTVNAKNCVVKAEREDGTGYAVNVYSGGTCIMTNVELSGSNSIFKLSDDSTLTLDGYDFTGVTDMKTYKSSGVEGVEGLGSQLNPFLVRTETELEEAVAAIGLDVIYIKLGSDMVVERIINCLEAVDIDFNLHTLEFADKNYFYVKNGFTAKNGYLKSVLAPLQHGASKLQTYVENMEVTVSADSCMYLPYGNFVADNCRFVTTGKDMFAVYAYASNYTLTNCRLEGVSAAYNTLGGKTIMLDGTSVTGAALSTLYDGGYDDSWKTPAADEPVVVPMGDLNNDGEVTLIDAIILSRHIAEWGGYETLPFLG